RRGVEVAAPLQVGGHSPTRYCHVEREEYGEAKREWQRIDEQRRRVENRRLIVGEERRSPEEIVGPKWQRSRGDGVLRIAPQRDHENQQIAKDRHLPPENSRGEENDCQRSDQENCQERLESAVGSHSNCARRSS